MTDEKQSDVRIPGSLYERVAKTIANSRFRSVDEYVTQAVREKLSQDESGRDPGYTKEEEEKVKERLRALGYI